jgi:hypothetical protein
MSNINSGNKSLSEVDLWIINRLLQQQPITLLSLIREYAQERGVELQHAKRILLRRIKNLEQKGIIVRTKDKPVSISLSPVFDLNIWEKGTDRAVTSNFQTSSGNSETEMSELRKLGLRTVYHANEYRLPALETINNKTSVQPYTSEFQKISKLFNEHVEEMKNSVLLFRNIKTGDFVKSPHPSRFVNKRTITEAYRKAVSILNSGFSKHEHAVFVTLTLPRIFHLSYRYRDRYLLLQDSVLMSLKNELIKWLRQFWKGKKLEVFTALEYHNDFALHVHVVVFGIPHLIEWSRKVGPKKELAIVYYARKFGVDIPPGVPFTVVSKRIITKLLHTKLVNILHKIDKKLGTGLLSQYLQYVNNNNLDGPVNDIRRVKNGNWMDEPPPEAVTTSKTLTPKEYLLKYLTKMMKMIKDGKFDVKPEHFAKYSGYWLFAKRFYTYSPSLLPDVFRDVEHVEEKEWKFLGIYDEVEADEIISSHGKEPEPENGDEWFG